MNENEMINEMAYAVQSFEDHCDELAKEEYCQYLHAQSENDSFEEEDEWDEWEEYDW